jgi:hypothetical protein
MMYNIIIEYYDILKKIIKIISKIDFTISGCFFATEYNCV